jgi:hypothetical protein
METKYETKKKTKEDEIENQFKIYKPFQIKRKVIKTI